MTDPISLTSLPAGGVAVIIGAGGAIGGALAGAAAGSGRFSAVLGLSRGGGDPGPGVRGGRIDIEDEASIARAAASLADGPPLRLLIIATGILHGEDFGPEKALRALDPAVMARLFAINTIGPALVLKHFTPLLAKQGKAVVAALSARVGSLGDNRLGGWHSYRASKAALNMILRNAAIELARGRPEAVCLALHPGTVDSPLSQPFQAGVATGGLFSPGQSAAHLLAVIDARGPADSGQAFAWDNSPVPW